MPAIRSLSSDWNVLKIIEENDVNLLLMHTRNDI